MSKKKKNKPNPTWHISESKVYFDKDNYNALVFEGPEMGQKHFVSIPPGKNRVDLLHFQGICGFRLERDYDPGYVRDYTGLMIISYQRVRKVFWGTKMIAKTKI